VPVELREVSDVLIADVGRLITGPALPPHEECPFFRENFNNYLCDIRSCPKFDSGAIANVVCLYWQLRPRGVTFKVLVDSSQLRFFELTELDSVFSVFVNEAEAIASFARSA
jgi:hypothetical protein